MKAIGYIRVSTDQQDLDKQKHLLLDYAQQHQVLVREFIEVESSAQKDRRERKIDVLLETLNAGDQLLVAELSRLGRNMLETLNIIHTLSEKGIRLTFVRQPELSTTGPHTQLLLAIYGYFAEAEREYISIRTKQGLAAAKAQGKQLGRPKGSKNRKGRVLDPFKAQIKHYLELQLPLSSITKIVNNQLETPLSYNSFKYFIQHDDELFRTLERKGSTASVST